jgi:peroxiredoxin
MLKHFCGFALVLGMIATASRVHAAETAAIPPQDRVPQYLLGLVHAPQVQQEIKLTPAEVAKLEAFLGTIDAKWLPVRPLPEPERRAAIAELETQVWKWLSTHSKPAQVERLRQLELYAQGTRMLLRPDVAEQIGLDAAQQVSFAKLTLATEEAAKALAQTPAGDAKIPGLQEKLRKATQAERDGLKTLKAEQQQRLQKLLGEPFDVGKLSRIYPLAPEFPPEVEWLNSAPLSLKQLRGKVVVIHFYAFQCSNCHANFPIYRRWHQEWADKDVVLIGIQTPETEAEHKLEAVRVAAKEKELTFPIVADLKSECWKSWGNTMWPTVWVVDKHGYLRVWWEGELNWQGATGDKTVESTVERLLQEE